MPSLADYSCGDGLMGSYSDTRPVNHTRYTLSSEDSISTNKLKTVQVNGVQKLKLPPTVRNGAGDGIPLPQRQLFDSSKLRLHWSEKRSIGSGLTNVGNTCFLNSVLQCLAYTPPLSHHLLNDNHKKFCKLTDFCMLCTLQDHIAKSFCMRGQSWKPLLILQNLKNIAKCFTWGHQEDAHEFLRYVVDSMQKACLTGVNGLDKFSKETTLVHQVFGGYLRSQVKCQKCQHASNTYDPFLDISVDIKDSDTLQQAMAKFVHPEMLEIENAYKCERCKVKVPAQKRFTIHRSSNVLTVHLKRFDMNRLLGAKVSRHIQFPMELNVRPYMSLSHGDPVNYLLYGVLVHSGFSCNSGHYYAYVKAPNNQWYCMNDSTVSMSDPKKVLAAEAYILFYVKSQRRHNYVNGKAPHTITHADMVNGSGDHLQFRRKMIGPQLPTTAQTSGSVTPSVNPFAVNRKPGIVSRTSASKPNGTMSREVVKPLDATLPNNQHNKVAVPSLVPYSEQSNSDDETVNTDNQKDEHSNKSAKLTLSQYSARQEGKTADKQSTKLNGEADVSAYVLKFMPRALKGSAIVHSNTKVMQSLQKANNSNAEALNDPNTQTNLHNSPSDEENNVVSHTDDAGRDQKLAGENGSAAVHRVNGDHRSPENIYVESVSLKYDTLKEQEPISDRSGSSAKASHNIYSNKTEKQSLNPVECSVSIEETAANSKKSDLVLDSTESSHQTNQPSHHNRNYRSRRRSSSGDRQTRRSPTRTVVKVRRSKSRDAHTSHSRSEHKSKLRGRSRSRERHRSRSAERRRSRSREQHRSRSGERHRSRSRERHRSRSRERHRSRSGERHRSRSGERHRSRSGGRHRSRSRERQSRSRGILRSKSRDKYRSRSRGKRESRSRNDHRSRSYDRHRSKSKGRRRSRSNDRHRHKHSRSNSRSPSYRTDSRRLWDSSRRTYDQRPRHNRKDRDRSNHDTNYSSKHKYERFDSSSRKRSNFSGSPCESKRKRKVADEMKKPLLAESGSEDEYHWVEVTKSSNGVEKQAEKSKLNALQKLSAFAHKCTHRTKH